MIDTSLITISLGDIYELKKKHPCGCKNFEVVRIGADCKIKCLGCGHIILIDRVELKKRIKTLISKGQIEQKTA